MPNIPNTDDAIWGAQDNQGECAGSTVFIPAFDRVSDLLDADGEPLRVGYERPAVGFDLRPTKGQ